MTLTVLVIEEKDITRSEVSCGFVDRRRDAKMPSKHHDPLRSRRRVIFGVLARR